MDSPTPSPGSTAKSIFEHFASSVTKATGSSAAFLSAFASVMIWGLTGPLFHFSETWQLVINTGTTIITFLMIFLIQNRAAGASSKQGFHVGAA